MSLTHNYSGRTTATTTTTAMQGSTAWLLSARTWSSRAHLRCCQWLQLLQIDAHLGSGDFGSAWCIDHSWAGAAAAILSLSLSLFSLFCISLAPTMRCTTHCKAKTPTKAAAGPWTEVNKRSLICAIPPSPSTRRLAVCEHNNILPGQTWKVPNPFTRGDLTTSCSLLSAK